MTREEREKFVRSRIYQSGSWEDAVTEIVDKWENEVDERYQDGLSDGWRER